MINFSSVELEANGDIKDIVDQLLAKTKANLKEDPKALIVFSPYQELNHGFLLKTINEAVDCPIIGGTSYGPIMNSSLKEGSIVMTALSGDGQSRPFDELRPRTFFGQVIEQ